jgi:hypothetical protein
MKRSTSPPAGVAPVVNGSDGDDRLKSSSVGGTPGAVVADPRTSDIQAEPNDTVAAPPTFLVCDGKSLEETVILAADFCLWNNVLEMVTVTPGLAKTAVHKSTGRTLLHFAARFRAPKDLIELLIRLNPVALLQLAFSVGEEDDDMFFLSVGNTPLHEACRGPGLLLTAAFENLQTILEVTHEDFVFGEVSGHC